MISSSPLAVDTSPVKASLSSSKSLCVPALSASQVFGHCGELWLSQPGSPSAGYGSLPCGPWWWQCGREKSAQRPFPNGPVPWYCPPVTVPCALTCSHGVSMSPPSQPSSLAQKQMSSADKGTWYLASVAMQRRSEAASAAAKAQQHPQLLWSRMSVMIFAHFGHCSAESKLSGSSTPSGTVCRTTRPAATAAARRSAKPSFTPQRFLDAPGGASAKRALVPATHSGLALRMASIC